MLNEEFKARLSPKLLAYIEKIEFETGRQAQFEYVDDFGSPGMQFGFRKDPTYLCIAAKSGISLNDPRIERSFAHEMTHCYLIYGRGYYGLDAIDGSSDEDFLHLNLLSFIDDIVVNKIIEENSFPNSDTYPKMLRSEIELIKKGLNPYALTEYRDFNARYPVSRYILAWAGLKYQNLPDESKKLANQFLKVFPSAFPAAFQTAKSLREAILKDNVFTADGHKEIIQFMLKEWGLENRCSFRSYKV